MLICGLEVQTQRGAIVDPVLDRQLAARATEEKHTPEELLCYEGWN